MDVFEDGPRCYLCSSEETQEYYCADCGEKAVWCAKHRVGRECGECGKLLCDDCILWCDVGGTRHYRCQSHLHYCDFFECDRDYCSEHWQADPHFHLNRWAELIK